MMKAQWKFCFHLLLLLQELNFHRIAAIHVGMFIHLQLGPTIVSKQSHTRPTSLMSS